MKLAGVMNGPLKVVCKRGIVIEAPGPIPGVGQIVNDEPIKGPEIFKKELEGPTGEFPILLIVKLNAKDTFTIFPPE